MYLEIVKTLDSTHTQLSYVKGSLKNVTVVKDEQNTRGFIFSLLNPPVPLGGNVISVDIEIDNLPVPRKSIFVSTSELVINASILSENRPIPFKPFQSARFLVVLDGKEEQLLLAPLLNGKKKHKIVIMSRLEGFEEIRIPFTFTDYISGHEKERIIIPSPEDNGNNNNNNSNTLLSYPEEEEPNDDLNGGGTIIFKNFTAPLILSGKKAYIVCSTSGSLSANWTWMGVRYDNGGLYVPPARAFGRVILEVSVNDGVRKRLPNFVVSSKHEYGVLSAVYDLAGGLRIKRRLTVPLENKGFIVAIELELLSSSSKNGGNCDVGSGLAKIAAVGKRGVKKMNVRLHFLIDGNITSYGLAAVSQNIISKFNTADNCLQISPAAVAKNEKIQQYFGTIGIAPKSIKPCGLLTDSFDNDLELSYDVEVEAGKPVKIALVGTGSFSNADECLAEFRFMRDNYDDLLRGTQDAFRQFAATTLSMRPSWSSSSSDEKKRLMMTTSLLKLARSYEKAKASMQYLKGEYDGLGEGICAGLPRFPNYWARDTGWSLRGYLSIGDFSFARSVIDNFLRHQAKKTISKGAACAVVGELPMIISGKAFLHTTTYGSADSTFLFPWAIREYVLSTGDLMYLQKRWDSVIKLVDCGLLKDIDGDGLVDHGFTGTAEKLPIQDSTWMDHIDRRKSANDVQALLYESLTVGSELAGMADDGYNKIKWSQKAEDLKSRIDREYWNNKEGFYYDTIRKDGSKDASIRPNALVLLLTGAVKDRIQADMVLERIEREDMTTSWGVRTLSNKDLKYHPALYHDGAVWPLVTGWAALSEIKLGRRKQAFNYVNSMAERILKENGMFAETYRGDRPEPFNSCILQAWSVGMFTHALREMMLGMKVNMLENIIKFEPQIDESILMLDNNNSLPIVFEYSINARDGRGRLQIAVNSYQRKISVMLKEWQGRRPEFVCRSSYGINVS